MFFKNRQSRNVLFWRLTHIDKIKSIDNLEMLQFMNKFGKKFSLVWFDIKEFFVQQKKSNQISNKLHFRKFRFHKIRKISDVESDVESKLNF